MNGWGKIDMKRTIRNGVFETNSSSMHSIVITKEKGENCFLYEDWKPEKYTVWDHDISFGRTPFEILNTVYDKARYAIASAGTDEKKVSSIIKLVKEISDVELDVKKNKEELFRDCNGNVYHWCDIEWIPDEDEKGMEYPILWKERGLPPEQQTTLEFKEIEKYPGYIDHQSLGLLDRFLAKEEIDLKEFLLNKKYVVVIDGDEYCTFESLVSSGLVDKNNIVDRVM